MSAACRPRRRRREIAGMSLVVAVATGAMAIVAPAPARAVELVVDSASALADGEGVDGMSLADAVTVANADAGLDTITFDPALVASLVAPIDTVAVPEITADLVIVGPGAELLTLTDSDGPGLAVGNGATLTVSGVRIEGPLAGGAPAPGIVAADAGDVAVTDVEVADASDGIAAAWTVPGTGSISLDRVEVTGVVRGIAVSGAAEVDVTGVVVDDASGAGIEVLDATGAVAVADTEVAEAAGAAIEVDGAGDVTLDDVAATRAAAGAAPAGAVRVTDAGRLGVVDVDVTRAGGSGLRFERVELVDVEFSTVIDSGAGLEVLEAGPTTITSSTMSGNAAAGLVVDRLAGPLLVTGSMEGNGGHGIDVGDTPPAVVVDDVAVTVRDAVAVDNAEGGIRIAARDDVVIDGVLVDGNGVGGSTPTGGIALSGGVAGDLATISDVTISDNRSDAAGGLTVDDAGLDVVVERATFEANTGTVADVASANSSAATITASTIAGTPDAADAGPTTGFAAVDGTLVVARSTVSSVAAPDLATAGAAGTVAFDDATLSANRGAGALLVATAGGVVRLLRTTVSGNTVTGSGAGLLGGAGTVVATSSILSGNGVGLLAGGATVALDVDHSLRPPGPTIGGVGNVVAADPGLGPLRDNDGDTPTMLPAAASPAVDAGDPAIAGGSDQRGLDRVVGGRADIGAVERQRSPFVVGVEPARVLETRSGPTFTTIDGEFQGIGRRRSGSELRLPVGGRAGVPADAEAVVVNVTAVRPSGVGFVTVHPCLVNPPLASSLNFRTDAESGNEIVAALDGVGDLCLFVRTDTDLVVDVVGYVPDRSRYTSVGPARLLDTRATGATIDGRFERIGIRRSDTELALDVAGRGGVSADATAVVVNVTAVKPEAVGYVTVHPCLPTEPTAASLNFAPGVNRGNEIVAQLDGAGRLCLYTFGSAELVVDVVGELSSENVYTPVAPARLVETRALPNRTVDGAQQGIGLLAPREVLRVSAAGRAGVPDGSAGVVVNVTAIRPELRGFVTVWDCEGTMPVAASLNFAAGEIVGNELVVDLNGGGDFCVFTNRRSDLTVDVVGSLE